jgi:penicillin-binding protein 1A
MKKNGASDDDIKAAFSTPQSISLFSWDGARQVEMTPLDSVKYYLRILNAGFMAINPNSGELKAYIGGDNFRYFKYDHVGSKRQVGSTFKPIVYLAALEAGISPDTYFPNERKVYTDYGDWSPENSHDDYTGYYSMEGALAKSINTIAVDVLMRTGIDSVIDLAHRMGIDSDLPEYPSLALGVASVSLEEMVCAYSEIVNGGHKITPYYLKSVATNSGEILEEFKNVQPDEQVASPENCRIITQMLKGVVNEGTGSAIRTEWGIDCDFAGKTGTTQDQTDGWFIGMTPGLVAGAWVGGDDPSIHFTTLGAGAGGHTALPIVGEFFSQILKQTKYSGMRTASFELPSAGDLALLNIPPYREILEVKGRGFLHDLFVKKDHHDLVLKKSGPAATEHQEQEQQVVEPAKRTVWQSIRDIFKKKKR